MQLGQEQFVQLLPHTGLVPVPQPPPAGHPRTEAQLLRQELPGNAGVEHEQDAGQNLPVVQTPAARMIGTTSNNGWIRAHNSSGTIHGGCSPFLTR
jgi:hypothetical protein